MSAIFRSGYEINVIAVGVEFTAISCSIGTANVRSGQFAGRSNPTAAPSASRYSFAAADTQGPFYARCYYYIVALPTSAANILSFQDNVNAPKITVSLSTTGRLSLLNAEDSIVIGNPSSPLSLNTWFCVELFINNTTLSSTSCEARLEGQTIASGTANLANGIARLSCGALAIDATLDVWMDDIGLNDTTGSFDNSWCGSEKLICLRPNAAGDVNTFVVQTGGTLGAANNFTRVNENPPDDATSFNGSGILNQEDLFNFDDAGLSATDTINRLQVSMRMANDIAVAITAIKAEIEKTSGGTILQSTARTVNTTTWITNSATNPRTPLITANLDPDGNPWTSTTADSFQAGYKITTGGIHTIQVTNIWVYLGYTPAAPPVFEGTSRLLMGVGI